MDMTAIEKEDKVTIILAEEINGGSLGYKILSYDIFRAIAKRILAAISAEKLAVIKDSLITPIEVNFKQEKSNGS